VGPLEPSKGLRDAIWAFDILHFVFDDLHLLIIGVGPEAPRLREFAQIARVAGRVHFLGRRADLRTLMAHAEIVWVPSRADRGLNVSLEAMAAGKPVVASRWPMLAETVIDGETGVLVARGDKGALARETRLLLDDAERRTRLGNAGRRRAEERFGLEAMKRRFDEVIRAAHAAQRSKRLAPLTPLRYVRGSEMRCIALRPGNAHSAPNDETDLVGPYPFSPSPGRMSVSRRTGIELSQRRPWL
jgi:glycosyltransferase involved in cell wall biosynthesis